MEEASNKRRTREHLQQKYQSGEKIAVLTCYDATFANVLEKAGIDILLVGDSLGNVIQGKPDTLSVSLEDMLYHTTCVARSTHKAFIIADMPFGTFQVSPQETFTHAARLLAAGAQMVKIEVGRHMAETVDFLTNRGIPVCAHIGLTPQSLHQLGGYKLQGKKTEDAQRLREDAMALQEAGTAMLVMEMMPATLAGEITQRLSIPTIGIGAGSICSGQVLVLHDMLGIYPGKPPRFVRNFLQDTNSIHSAVEAYVQAVRSGMFPANEHAF